MKPVCRFGDRLKVKPIKGEAVQTTPQLLAGHMSVCLSVNLFMLYPTCPVSNSVMHKFFMHAIALKHRVPGATVHGQTLAFIPFLAFYISTICRNLHIHSSVPSFFHVSAPRERRGPSLDSRAQFKVQTTVSAC